MVKSIEAAVEKLKSDPGQPVTAEIGGLIIELRYKGRLTADDAFQEAGLWEGDDAIEVSRAIREARRQGGSKEPPRL